MRVLSNVYYSPEVSGLAIFDSIDTAGSYEFDIFLILIDNVSNKLYYCKDSGCSCPTPFENVTEINEIDNETFYNFEKALENHYNISREDFLRMCKSVKDHLNNSMKNVINDAVEFFE